MYESEHYLDALQSKVGNSYMIICLSLSVPCVFTDICCEMTESWELDLHLTLPPVLCIYV